MCVHSGKAKVDANTMSLIMYYLSLTMRSLVLSSTNNQNRPEYFPHITFLASSPCFPASFFLRFLGDAGANIQRSNILNTITCMKLLVGRKYEEEDVQQELARYIPFRYLVFRSFNSPFHRSLLPPKSMQKVEYFILLIALILEEDTFTESRNNYTLVFYLLPRFHLLLLSSALFLTL